MKILMITRLRTVMKRVKAYPKKVRIRQVASSVKMSPVHSRNASVRKGNQPSLRFIPGTTNRKLRAVRAIVSDQDAVKQFSAALRIQAVYKQYRFKKFLTKNAQSKTGYGYDDYVELDPHYVCGVQIKLRHRIIKIKRTL